MFGDEEPREIQGLRRVEELGEPAAAGAGGEAALLLEIKRRWALAATARVVYEHGHDAVTVPWVAQNAGLPPELVRSVLPTPQRCLTAAFDLTVAVAAERVLPLFASQVDALSRVRVGARELLGFCEREPELSSTVVLPSPATARRRALLTTALGRILADELDRLVDGRPSPEECTGCVASAFDLAAGRLTRQDRRPLDDLLEPVLETVLAPGLGRRAARIQAARPIRAPRGTRAQVWGERRLTLDLRLTVELIEQLAAIRERSSTGPEQRGERPTEAWRHTR
jgi:hypothetical protein